MPCPPKTWKKAELAVARLLGGRRCHFEVSDVEAGGWAVEVKHGRQIPRTLLKWWGQAEQNAGDGKSPLLALHPTGAAYADSLAVVRLADLAELHPVRRKGVKTETDRVWATPDR
jgi:hypothetical protein